MANLQTHCVLRSPDMSSFQEACIRLGVQQEWFENDCDKFAIVHLALHGPSNSNQKALDALCKRSSGQAKAYFSIAKEYVAENGQSVSVLTDADRAATMFMQTFAQTRPNMTHITTTTNQVASDLGTMWYLDMINESTNVQKKVVIEARFELSEKDICTIARFICNQHTDAETSFTAIMQIDTHCTKTESDNSPWIGMSLTVTSTSSQTVTLKVPIQIISADIGCGLSVFPVVVQTPAGYPTEYEQMNWSKMSTAEQWIFQTKFMLSARLNLIRGKAVENGEAAPDIAAFFRGCSEFLKNAPGILPIEIFATEMHQLLTDLNFDLSNPALIKAGPLKINSLCMTMNQTIALRYVFGYLCSLGSAGNHFAELAVDATDFSDVSVIIHSGSRGIGAKIFDAINFLCVMQNGSGIATDKLSALYTRAYDLLQQVAFYNRFICCNAILGGIDGIVCDAEIIRDTLYNSKMLSRADPSIRHSLLKGMIHNGLSAFADDKTHRLAIILKKGSIAMSNGAGIGFVALSAGVGCIAFIRNDPNIAFREISLGEASERLVAGYKLCNFSELGNEIGTYGHGSGRERGANATSKNMTHEHVQEHATDNCYICNRGPGIYGDGPGAYRAPRLDHYGPETTQLKTLVSFKECITHVPHEQEKFVSGLVSDLEKFGALGRSVANVRSMIESPDHLCAVNAIVGLDLILVMNMFEGRRVTGIFKDNAAAYTEMCATQTDLIRRLIGPKFVHAALA